MEGSTWQPIETAPTDNREFYVGAWSGPTIWDETNGRHVFTSEPVWISALSHHDNPMGPFETRGWNHRNGPLAEKATHWAPVLHPPKFVGFVVKEYT